MKLFLIGLLSLLSFHCCTGYPVVENAHSEEFLLENATSIENLLDSYKETVSNDSSLLDMDGIGKKVVEEVKDDIRKGKSKGKSGFDKVKDKVKDGFDKVKDKVKDIYDKVKDKVKDFKDKIGSKGGSGGGGGYYRDKYDRDYDRDRYDRDKDRDRYNRDYYRKDNDYSGGVGSVDPNAIPIIIGVFSTFLVLSLVFIGYMKLKEINKRNISTLERRNSD